MSDPLDYVHATLQALHDSGAKLSAPRETVARLRQLPKPAEPKRIERTIAPRVEAPAPSIPSAPSVPFTPLAPTTGTKAARLDAMRGPVLACTKCPHLVASRTQVVFGVGTPEAELMFVGEAPGEDEDVQGEPFVGRAGELLTKIIKAMGFERIDVFIANILKCRPDMPPGVPGNRKPRADEMQTCLPYLREQIDIIQPRALVALGATALEGLTGQQIPVGRVRGSWLEFGGIPLMVTYHPAYLLRNQAISEKRKVWEDMLLVLEKLGHPISEKQRGFFQRA
ncbi:MAG: uracil-DNA glycosylase family protein [Chthoniobacteraceae bacterium]